MNITSCVAILSGLLLCVPIASAQTSQVIYDTGPLDRTLTQLPPGYVGHDPKVVFDALVDSKKSQRKGEFETTAEYQQRLAISAQRITEHLSFEDLFGFVIFQNSLRLGYDADAKKLTTYLVEDRNSDESSTKGLTRFTIRIDTVDLGSQSQQNAYGAKVTVQRSLKTWYVLAVPTKDLNALPRGIAPLSDYEASMSAELRRDIDRLIPRAPPVFLSFNVEAAEARMLKESDRLRVLAVVRAEPPYFRQFVSNVAPTLRLPRDSTIILNDVYASLAELWLFDRETGKVYLKWKLVDQQARPTTSPTDRADRPRPERVWEQGRDGIGRLKLKKVEKAQYTVKAREQKIEGTVVLNARFHFDGTISDIEIVEGLPGGLTESAIEAAKNIKFEPARDRNGQPVTVIQRLEFRFRL